MDVMGGITIVQDILIDKLFFMDNRLKLWVIFLIRKIYNYFFAHIILTLVLSWNLSLFKYN